MNGPQHFAEAERLLGAVKALSDRSEFDADAAMVAMPTIVAMAQVHATLAIAAATALGPVFGDEAPTTGVAFDWRQHVAVRTPAAEEVD